MELLKEQFDTIKSLNPDYFPEDIYQFDLLLFDIDLETIVNYPTIDELKNIGCDSARSVLDLSIEELVNRTDLEEETILEVIRILRSEFE